MSLNRKSFSVLWGSEFNRATEDNRPFATNAEAKAARDAYWRELKAKGIVGTRSVLKGQLRQYWSFGVECGESCDVYEIYLPHGSY